MDDAAGGGCWKSTSSISGDQYGEVEQARLAQEKAKLIELKQAMEKRKDMEVARKQKLSGAFALTEDDIDEPEMPPGKIRKSSSSSSKRRMVAGASGSAPLPYETSLMLHNPELDSGEAPTNLQTAADLDGKYHTHKFSAVWKDWSSSKKDDPGEIAKQFMKIAAIKRRGYDPVRNSRGH